MPVIEPVNIPKSLSDTCQPRATPEPSTATYTVLLTDDFIRIVSGTFDLTLPTSGVVDGDWFEMKNVGAGVVTVKGTIDGVVDKTLATTNDLVVMFNGVDWDIIS